MTITRTIIELKESRIWNLQPNGGESSVTCVYLARWFTDLNDAYDGDALMLSMTGAPMPHKRPPTELHGGDAWIKDMICRGVNWSPATEAPYAWRVTATYTANQVVSKTNGGENVRRSINTQVRNAPIYRVGMTIPADGTQTFVASPDIGGSKVDINGNPRQTEIVQYQIQLEYIWDRTPTNAAPTVAQDPPFNSFAVCVNTRNDDTFMGFVKGTCLYKGCAASLENELWRLTHTFIFDDLYHLEQVPAPTPTGTPLLLPGITIGTVQILQTQKVVYLQRYPTFTNFKGTTAGGIFPDDVAATFTQSWPPDLA